MIEYAIQNLVPKDKGTDSIKDELKAVLAKIEENKLEEVPPNVEALKNKILQLLAF